MSTHPRPRSRPRFAALLLPLILFASPAAGTDGHVPGNWLDIAKQRIDRHRKADLRLSVTEGGQPVTGATVRVEMTRHAFPFGSAVTARRLVADDSEDGERYRRTVSRLFTRVVFENDLKWPAWSGEWGEDFDRDQTLRAIQWLEDRDISVRGHCLVWPGWKHLPTDVRELKNDPARLERRVRDHVRELASTLRGHIVEWDVVNETHWNQDLQNLLGRDVMIDWFRIARAADPSARLFINDARIVSFFGVEEEHKQFYYNEVKYLVEQGAPIDGIGLQGHFREATLTPPVEAWKVLDRFAAFGLDLGITEFDIHTGDEQLQARYLHDFMHVAFSHPAVTEIILWGFWEGQVFKKPRALYRTDWSPKPAGEMFETLVLDTWRTRETGTTDEHGAYTTRGFLGDYTVEVTTADRSRTVRCTLGNEGLELDLDLSASSAPDP